jgi:hypothetical protein
MKRLLLTLSLCLLSLPAQAYDRANWFSTRGVRAFGQALTDGGIFGAPRHTTALLPTCNAGNEGGIAYDLTLNAIQFCDGSAWGDVGGGVALDGNNTWAGTQKFPDNVFQIVGSADATKIAVFEVDGITTGTTRTYTLPNATSTVAVLGLAQTWTQAQTFNSGANLLFGTTQGTQGIQGNTAQTPDTVLLFTGTTSNSWHVAEVGDAAFDFNNGPCGTAACTHPTLNVHSATQNVTEYDGLAYFGRAGNAIKTLTESSATAVVAIPVAASAGSGGILEYGIFAADATDQQLRQSSIRYSITNKAATETCTLTAMDGATANAETNDDNAASISAGTLTYAIACDCTAANSCSITFNAVSSLTQTTLQARWSISHTGPGLPAPQ